MINESLQALVLVTIAFPVVFFALLWLSGVTNEDEDQ